MTDMKGLYPEGMPLSDEEARDDLRARRARAFAMYPRAALFLDRLAKAREVHRVDYEKKRRS